jgi:glycosyltransferase involved in cell wall biosynthesis
MKRALISTVYNEARSIRRWVAAILNQTVRPDEFVIVDGGSTDDTVRLLREGFENSDFTPPRIIIRPCNIAGGRNLAIQNTTAELIAATDAGAVPDPRWLEEIIRPFEEESHIDVVGGRCPAFFQNAFQERIKLYMGDIPQPAGSDCWPSSRNVAFTRASWAAVGGYPEWLTLTAEDSLFDSNLHYAGFRFYHQPSAVVSWEGRPDLARYLKMMYNYGYGSAEAGFKPRLYLSWLLTTLIPPLILFSRRPLADAPLRYLRNAATAWGWVKGKISGRKPPEGWRYLQGAWMSPETLAVVRNRSAH